MNIPVLPGMREDLDPALLPPGVPAFLQNVRCYQQGRLDKRPGTKLLATSGLPDNGATCWLSSQGGRAVAGIQEADSSDRISFSVYAQRSADDAAAWVNLGAHGGVVPVRRFSVSPQSTTGVKHLSCARIGDLIYVSYTEVSGSSNTTNVQIVTLDGTVLRGRALSFASNSRLVYVNGVLFIIYCNTGSVGSNDIEARVVDQSTLSFASASTLASSGGTDFDVALLEGSSTDFLLVAADGTTSIGVWRLSSALATVASATITAAAAASLVGIAGYTGTHVMVGWAEGGGTGDVRISFRNPTTLANVATVLFDGTPGNEVLRYQVGFVRRTASEWIVTIGGEDATSASPSVPYGYFKFGTANSGTLTAGSPQKVSGFGLASKPFVSAAPGEDNVAYAWAHTQGNATKWRSQAAHYVISFDTSAIGIAAQARLEAISYEHIATYGPSTSFMSQLPTVENIDGHFAAPLNWADPSLTGVDVAVFTVARRQDSISGAHRFAKERSGALIVSGGWLYEHAGARGSSNATFITENGFAYDPEITTALAAGGSLTSGQEYTYRALYRWTDALGRVHRSTPSEPVTATPSGGNLTVRVAAAPLRLSGRFNIQVANIEVEFYRSWLGGPYYFCGSVTQGTVTEPVLADASADSSVEANTPLYTDLGILPTDPPSGARLWCEGGSRVFVVGWRENVVQFSKLLIPTAPIEFVDDDAFRIFVSEPITAIWYLDGALVIFCAARAYLVTGDGPDDTGVGRFSEPRPLPVTASCDDARSLLEVAQGLLFKGGGTIWLLPRGFAPPVPIGDAVGRTLASYSFTTGAALSDQPGSEGDSRSAHFALATSDTDAGASTLVAVYDLERGTWSLDYIGGENIGAVTSLDGEFYWAATSWATASTASPIRRFSSTEFQDYDSSSSALWITSEVRLGWVRPFGVLGWGRIPRVQLFGYVPGACRLQLSGSVNDVSFAPVTHEFTTTGFVSYLEHAFANTPANSVQLTLTDAISEEPGAVPTAGYSIRALALEVQPEAGLRRVDPTTERF